MLYDLTNCFNFLFALSSFFSLFSALCSLSLLICFCRCHCLSLRGETQIPMFKAAGLFHNTITSVRELLGITTEVLLTILGWRITYKCVERVSLTPKNFNGIASDHSYSVEVWVEKKLIGQAECRTKSKKQEEEQKALEVTILNMIWLDLFLTSFYLISWNIKCYL